MSDNHFSGNDTAPYPAPPPFGPAQQPGDDEADAWLQPVTYDQTDYQDLDAYLASQGAGEWEGSYSQPGYPASRPGYAAPPGSAAGSHDAAHAGYSGDDSAHADPYAYGSLGSAQPEPRRRDRRAPDEEWAPPDEEWAPPDREPDEEWPRDTRRPPGRAPSLRRRPRWVLPAAIGLAAAAVGSGVVIVTTGGTSRSASGLPIFSASPAMTPTPVLISPGAAGSGTAAGQPSAPGASPPATASPGMTAPGTGSPAALRPPITRARAQQVLAAYTTANNMANASASDSLIATVEAGSSRAIDQGIYRGQRARKSPGFPPFAPVSARYYLPLEDPASYPHWFAVRVSNAPVASPGTVTSREYIVFTQDTPGGPWLDAIEPFLAKGISPPPVALDANGYAKAVTAGPLGLAVSPAAVSAATAIARDSGTGQPSTPGNLPVDQARAAVLRQLPKGSSAVTRHAGTQERVFGLRTADGGALLFYDVAARLTVTAPAGSTLHLDIPGWTSASEGAGQLRLGYLEQFATYDPPAAKGTPAAVIAHYSGIFRRA
jgi:hypothetical protein